LKFLINFSDYKSKPKKDRARRPFIATGTEKYDLEAKKIGGTSG
jgi:hypothetical protein